MNAMKTSHNLNSPSSSVDAPALYRPLKTVPISRTAAPGYDRPERARTSHACEPCRERKTKCDGERPACRRCVHTGTSCHYGYGKGWKKRKTAEDLTLTSRKLLRYEQLLTEIAPLVSPEVRGLIDDARREEASLASNDELPDGGPSASNSTPSLDGETRHDSPNSTRIPLPAPNPSPRFPHQPRSLPPPVRRDRVGESTPPLPGHPTFRSSETDDSTSTASTRLPSITPTGMLIENTLRTPSLGRPQPSSSDPPSGQDYRSPDSAAVSHARSISPQGGWSHGPAVDRGNADGQRDLEKSINSWLSEKPPHHLLPPWLPENQHYNRFRNAATTGAPG